MEWLVGYHGQLLTLHLAAVFSTLALVVVSDSYGLRWVLGHKDKLSPTLLTQLHRAVWFGLILTVIAGLGLFLPYAGFLLSDMTFRIKLTLVFFLVLNALAIGSHLHIATEKRFAELTLSEKWPLVLSGLISTTGWIGALIAAQFLPL